MAKEEHVARLEQGVEAWNAWRDENPDVNPDLSEANLCQADLRGANLNVANLSGTNLCKSDLSQARLLGAHMYNASLVGANLSGASLRDANLYRADLSQSYLCGTNLSATELGRTKFNSTILDEVDFRKADLRGAVFKKAIFGRVLFWEADLSGLNLSHADLRGAIFLRANLSNANLSHARLQKADFGYAQLKAANLCGANLIEADFTEADLRAANLTNASLGRAILRRADLSEADLTSANLTEATLTKAVLIGTTFTKANLTGCLIYGISAWGLKTDGVVQQNLIITGRDEPEITVDNIEVAQFVYLLLHNHKIRDVIDTITSKAVLILGRFTEERKVVLDALREELRRRDYLPILFDFDKPASRDITETISLLARMARFVVADITDARSIPQELSVIVPDLPSVPVQPLLLEGSGEYGMFEHFRRYPWVLPLHRYETQDQLIAEIGERVIEPAERRAIELRPGAN
ncbi:pentapeptide repeat-containing protein [Microvirga pakistanensis]|uniref:pentapeptide repeat-containing protein n=1 Tax=Microvirga pakistanensis TaxID=1682650 RepID=UPI00106922C9|nr:pentapeptide repeat-containing protein [Microvirga pakistanensis]